MMKHMRKHMMKRMMKRMMKHMMKHMMKWMMKRMMKHMMKHMSFGFHWSDPFLSGGRGVQTCTHHDFHWFLTLNRDLMRGGGDDN